MAIHGWRLGSCPRGICVFSPMAASPRADIKCFLYPMDTYTGASERDARYRALLDNVPDVLALLDHDGCITFVAGAVERITGYSANELLGHQAFEQVHPRDL